MGGKWGPGGGAGGGCTCRGLDGGSTDGGGGEGEGTPTILGPGGVVKLCTRPCMIGGGVNSGVWPDSRL